MNHKTEDNRLLDDVFASPADFREAMLGEMLRRACRRRRFRQTRNAAGIFGLLAMLGIFLWQKNLPQKTMVISAPLQVVKAIPQKNYELIQTHALPVNEIVTTQSLTAGRVVSSASAVAIVQTTSGNYRVINDDELLALLGPHPAILVRTGKNSEQLVFANPNDSKGFPLN